MPPRNRKAILQDTVRLSGEGLAKVMGELEARVLNVAWNIGSPATAREFHENIVRDHRVALLTVITVLNNLVGKGILSRRKSGGLLHYQPRFSENEFMARASRQVMEGIIALGPEAVSASLVDILAESDPDQLAELGRLVRRKLRSEEHK